MSPIILLTTRHCPSRLSPAKPALVIPSAGQRSANQAATAFGSDTVDAPNSMCCKEYEVKTFCVEAGARFIRVSTLSARVWSSGHFAHSVGRMLIALIGTCSSKSYVKAEELRGVAMQKPTPIYRPRKLQGIDRRIRAHPAQRISVSISCSPKEDEADLAIPMHEPSRWGVQCQVPQDWGTTLRWP
jgi:hypothetical protein